VKAGKGGNDGLKKRLVKHASVPCISQIELPRVPREKVEMVQLAENLLREVQ
jgi:hypothetical protein